MLTSANDPLPKSEVLSSGFRSTSASFWLSQSQQLFLGLSFPVCKGLFMFDYMTIMFPLILFLRVWSAGWR